LKKARYWKMKFQTKCIEKMKTEKQLNADILKITLKIAETFPELSKFIAETPVQKVEMGVSLNNLIDYCESLETLFRDYKKIGTAKSSFPARNQFIIN
jgi:hypothetical protein